MLRGPQNVAKRWKPLCFRVPVTVGGEQDMKYLIVKRKPWKPCKAIHFQHNSCSEQTGKKKWILPAPWNYTDTYGQPLGFLVFPAVAL